MHIISAEQFNQQTLEAVFDASDQMRNMDQASMQDRRLLAEKHIGRQIVTLFYEPSTRTRLSFEAAAVKLGAGVVSTESAGKFSSAVKGESLEDTIRVIDGYNFDAIIIRHPIKGSAAQAAEVSTTPIINAGDGSGEHPTQALLDLYTIHQHFQDMSGLKIVMGGDLKYGRTVRSLAQLLSNFRVDLIRFVSTPELGIEEDVKQNLTAHDIKYEETSNLNEALENADVVYWTRLQKERLSNPRLLKAAKFSINKRSLKILPEHAIIMHPLPRNKEIAAEVDNDPRAKYFKQAANGLYVRMAILDTIFND